MLHTGSHAAGRHSDVRTNTINTRGISIWWRLDDAITGQPLLPFYLFSRCVLCILRQCMKCLCESSTDLAYLPGSIRAQRGDLCANHRKRDWCHSGTIFFDYFLDSFPALHCIRRPSAYIGCSESIFKECSTLVAYHLSRFNCTFPVPLTSIIKYIVPLLVLRCMYHIKPHVACR